jgi:Protein of unknown function (DUF3102)
MTMVTKKKGGATAPSTSLKPDFTPAREVCDRGPLSMRDTSDEHVLELIGNVIDALRKKTVESILETGFRLIEAKTILGHGGWLPWLKSRKMSETTALNYMRVYETFKSATVVDLEMPVKSLYLLAAPSTPPEAVETVTKRAKAGERVRHEEVKDIVKEAKTKRLTAAERREAIKKASIAEERNRASKMAELDAWNAERRASHEAEETPDTRLKDTQQFSDPHFDASVLALKDFTRTYADISTWAKVISQINGTMVRLGMTFETPTPFGLVDHIKVLVERYGFEAVSDAVLEHTP